MMTEGVNMQNEGCGFDLSGLHENIKLSEGLIIPTYDWELLPPEVVAPAMEKYCSQMIRLSKERRDAHECASEKETIKP